MANYRTLESVSYVSDDKVVSVDADREVELTEEQALSLAGRVVHLGAQAPSMFPDGSPIIEHTIVRTVPATPVVGEPVVAPVPVKPVKPGDKK